MLTMAIAIGLNVAFTLVTVGRVPSYKYNNIILKVLVGPCIFMTQFFVWSLDLFSTVKF